MFHFRPIPFFGAVAALLLTGCYDSRFGEPDDDGEGKPATATIAALLHCSIRTVYNYRSFTQRHSRPDVGDLEQRVQLIGLNGIAARS